MLEFKIFLGSSFLLMGLRKKLGDAVRLLNDEWLKRGVRLRLYIWEDFIIGYSGKHKQQEYIDDMVLPSDLCVFMFSNRVGKFTKMELEAKLKDNSKAVFCYRLPVKGKYKDSVKGELEILGVPFLDVQTDDELCDNVIKLLEGRLNRLTNTNFVKMNDLFFYTTIPDDLSEDRSSIGTAFRNFNDVTMDEWGIHCVLHPMNQIELLDHTDHYIPILKKDVEKNDFEELKAGLERAKDSRIKRMTVFDRGHIYNDNPQVKHLLNDPGVFTDKISGLDALKWKLLDWLRQTRKTLFAPKSLSIKNEFVAINNNEFASVSSMGNYEHIQSLMQQIENQKAVVQQTLLNESENDIKNSNEVYSKNVMKAHLGLELALVLNGWNSNIIPSDDSCQEKVNKCLEIGKEVYSYLNGSMPKEDALHVRELLLEKEELEADLVKKGIIPSLVLLNTQLILVGLLDTFFSTDSDYRECEDRLFLRIVDGVDKEGLKDANAEMIRMNLGNMYQRETNYEEADKCYRKAIDNLKSLRSDSVRVGRLITIVYTHLFHMELERGNQNSYDTLWEFEEHVSGLDELNDSFLVDRCMFVTAELTQIDINNNSLYGVVESAIDLYEEAKENQLINDVESETFIDVMVYLPNMIARYHIDHLPESNNNQFIEFFEKAEKYLNEAYDNCVRMRSEDYEHALFELGEILHNRGFLYSKKIDRLSDSFSAYSEAYNLRVRYFNLTKETASETRVAQTLVNVGGLEVNILSLGHPTMDQLRITLHKADQALEIYGRHKSVDNPNGELEFYQALQLKATILDLVARENPDCVIAYNQAMNNYFLCWEWNKAHPGNQYRSNFINISGSILKERNFITEEEFEKVKKENEQLS